MPSHKAGNGEGLPFRTEAGEVIPIPLPLRADQPKTAVGDNPGYYPQERFLAALDGEITAEQYALEALQLARRQVAYEQQLAAATTAR